MDQKISVILPCRNEKEAIAETIHEIQKTAEQYALDIEIIVSDSSHDGSDVIAEREGAKIIKHDKEGYGFAIKEGISHAGGDIIIYADADFTYRLSDIPKFLDALKTNDVVIGSRLKGKVEKGAMPFAHRFFGTPMLNMLLFIFFGIRISDSQSGFRVLKKKTFEDLHLKTNGMEFATEMLIKAERMNMRIKEVPIHYAKRKGTSKLRRYRDGFAHLKYILIQTPFSFYAGIGGMLCILGISGFTWGKNVSPFLELATVKIFFPILGVQILFFGLFAKTYLMTRFNEPTDVLKKFYAEFRLPFALVLGLVFIGIAVYMKTTAGATHFDIILVSATLGIQIIFNSIILSTLSIK